ncbi:MAG: hypothetical protein JO071_08660 [Deltaproteobacteria bacterium]|nr:hypothetical protein [Deltaproteobacteria bacterium]
MKHFSGRWLWAALLILVLSVVGGLLLAGRSRVESAGGTGIVELAFTGTLSTSNGAPIANQYQRVLLNVSSVRLNTSTDLSLSDSASGWITIPLPAGMPTNIPTQFINTSLNFGSSGTLLTAPLSILQLDLMPLQNLPVFFNLARVPAETYGQIELVLDSTPPGNAVPLCPQSAPAGEGCVTYPAAFASQSGLRAQFVNGYAVPLNSVQPLVVNIAVTVGSPPAADPSTASVLINPVITPQDNLLSSGVTFSPALGIVTGTVTNFDLNTTTVTAEYAGTNQIVATTKLQTDGTFLLNLPASPAPNATSYDFYVSGNGAYVVRSHVAVSSQGTAPGSPPTTDLGILVVPGSTFGSLSGTIADACNGIAIEAATLRLLVPDTTTAGSATTCDLTGEPPAIPSNCVTVATAATDDLGHYPLPSTPLLSTPFTNVPVSPPPGVAHYNLEISGAGFNTTVPQVAAGLSCPTSRFPNSCSFNLEHGYLTGSVQLSGSNNTGNRLNAMVMAEDSGTDNIENLALATIPGSSASGTFTIAVPDANPSSDAIPVSNYDVFAAVQNLFQGLPQPNSGYLIGTAASVGAPPADCATIGIPALSPMGCTGLGSVFGSVDNANPSTTSVRLSKNGVQIMETEPNSIGVAPNGNSYNFCAPSDSYELTHYESGIAESSVPITLARPVTVGAPCATICQDGNPKGTCLLCQPVAAPTLP